MRLYHPAEQHVQREPDEQVQHNAGDRCGDCGRRAGQTFIAAKLFDERRGPKAQPGEPRHRGPGNRVRSETSTATASRCAPRSKAGKPGAQTAKKNFAITKTLMRAPFM